MIALLNLYIDLIFCISLFILTPLVILQPDSLEDSIVNVVALQVFIIVDDEIVRRVLNPGRSMYLTFENILTNHPAADFYHATDINESRKGQSIEPIDDPVDMEKDSQF